MNKIYVLFLVVLMVPAVHAQDVSELIWSEGQEGELKQWRILEETYEDAAVQRTGSFSWLKFHSMEKAIPQSLIFVDIFSTHTVALSSNGVLEYTLEFDSGVGAEGCVWQLETVNPGGFLSADLVAYPNFQTRCAAVADNISEGTVINFWINRTVLSGTPNIPIQSHIALTADRADFVVYPMDIEITNLWTQVPLITAFVLLAVGEFKRDFVYRALAGLALFVAAIFTEDYHDTFRALLAAGGFYLMLLYLLAPSKIGQRLRRTGDE